MNKKFLLFSSLALVGFVRAEEAVAPVADSSKEATEQASNRLDEFKLTLNEEQKSCFEGMIAEITCKQQDFAVSIDAAQKKFETDIKAVSEKYKEVIDLFKKFINQEDVRVQLRIDVGAAL